MKGYEDLIAGLCLLIVVLVGGYVYLDSQVYKQKQVLQIPQKHVEAKTFEVKVKETKE